MTIKVGDKIPSATLRHLTAEGPKTVTTDELFGGKKAVLFAVPGAFTPTCSAKHVPSFVQNFDELTAKGIEVIACLSVNDAFVMGAWGKDQKAEGKITKLSDGGGLQLWVTGDGAKRWRLAYRFAGSQKVLAIGVYPTIGLKDARAARQEAKRLLSNGIDPSQAKK